MPWYDKKMNKHFHWCGITHIESIRGCMQWFLVLGLFFLVGCVAAPTSIQSAPTVTAIPVVPTPQATATISAIPLPAATLFFADTTTTNLIIQQDQLSQTVVLSNTIDFVAIRDDGTQLAIQPHDADITILNLTTNTRHTINSRCDSMVWAPDGQNFICARYGNMYTIERNGMSDTLTTMAESPNAYAEFVWRPKSAQLWFTLVSDTKPKICSVSHSTAELLCVGNGQQPRWSPNGQWLAYRLGDSVTIQSADASQEYSVTGMRVDNLFWRDEAHLLLISNTRIMQYNLDDRQLTPQTLGADTWRLIGVGTPIR
jgi:Tol biopolymer transport system component